MEPNYQKQLFLWCKLKGYSMENTYPVYRGILNKILRQFPKLSETTIEQIQGYAASIPNEHTRRNTCVVIRWAFDKVLHKQIDWRDLPYPKRKNKVQPIYTTEEVMLLLKSIKHAKQKAIFALIVDCGLRVSEACEIQVADCNSKERQIVIRGAKGNNDRIVYPSDIVWAFIRTYWNENRKNITDKYLFDGQTIGEPYTSESVRGFVKSHCKLIGVKYKGIHAFRRYSITWCYENGASLNVLAQKSGHRSTKTIERHYLIHSPTYLKSVISPLVSA